MLFSFIGVFDFNIGCLSILSCGGNRFFNLLVISLDKPVIAAWW